MGEELSSWNVGAAVQSDAVRPVDYRDSLDPGGVLLEGLDVGKGCIRFKVRTVIPTARIEAFVLKAIDLSLQGSGRYAEE